MKRGETFTKPQTKTVNKTTYTNEYHKSETQVAFNRNKMGVVSDSSIEEQDPRENSSNKHKSGDKKVVKQRSKNHEVIKAAISELIGP